MGLDTVVASLYFCPAHMAIYGNLNASRIEIAGGYTGNLDYLAKGHDTFAHGQGELDVNIENLILKNLVVPIRYSTVTKRLQIDDVQFEATDKVVNPKLTGCETDHLISGQELAILDKSHSLPTLVEFMRSVINIKFKVCPCGNLALFSVYF